MWKYGHNIVAREIMTIMLQFAAVLVILCQETPIVGLFTIICRRQNFQVIFKQILQGHYITLFNLYITFQLLPKF